MARLNYFFLSDTIFEIGRDGFTPLRNALTQAAITSPPGAVSVQLHSRDAPTQPAIGSPFLLVHQGSPDGWWLYDIPHDFASGALVDGLQVLARVTVTSGSLNGYWELEGKVITQRGDSVT